MEGLTEEKKLLREENEELRSANEVLQEKVAGLEAKEVEVEPKLYLLEETVRNFTIRLRTSQEWVYTENGNLSGGTSFSRKLIGASSRVLATEPNSSQVTK